MLSHGNFITSFLGNSAGCWAETCSRLKIQDVPVINPRIKLVRTTYDAKTATSMVKACKAGSHARLILARAWNAHLVAQCHEYSLILDMISVHQLDGTAQSDQSMF